MSTKFERLDQVNDVIRAISNHGRRFFWNEKNKRVAEMLIGPRGHLFFRDDYSGELVYIAYKHNWRKFSHGGTLRQLVEGFADYIRTGDTLHPGNIGLEREWTDGDVWGYGADAIAAVKAELIDSPVFTKEGVA